MRTWRDPVNWLLAPTLWFISSIFLLMPLVIPEFAYCQGGPPLLTDDPETPGDGHWEINSAVVSELSANRRSFEVPSLDINYGWGERTQLKIETVWQTLSSTDLGSKSGFGTAIAGVKWRFFDQGVHGVSVSTYPQLEFALPFTSKDPDLIEQDSSIILPIEIGRRFDGGFSVAADVLYKRNISNGALPEWSYGTAVGYLISKRAAVLAEIHRDEGSDRSPKVTIVNLGTRLELSETLALLASIGSSIQSAPENERGTVGYLGVRFTQ